MRLLSNQHTLMPQPNAAQPCDSQNTTKTHQHTQIPITSQTYALRVVAKSTHIADKPHQESPHQQKPATMSHTQHNSINITPPPVIICVLYQTNTHGCHNQMLPNPVTHKTPPKPTHTNPNHFPQTYALRVVAKSTHIADKPYQESPHQQKPATMSHTQHNSIKT